MLLFLKNSNKNSNAHQKFSFDAFTKYFFYFRVLLIKLMKFVEFYNSATYTDFSERASAYIVRKRIANFSENVKRFCR